MSEAAAVRRQFSNAGPVAERRNLLVASGNPVRHADYLIRLEGRIENRGAAFSVGLDYIPDRAILDAGAFGAYLQALAAQLWNSIEEIGGAVLGDVESEVLPRYLRVTVRDEQSEAGRSHIVLFEGRQPDWKNDALLARLF